MASKVSLGELYILKIRMAFAGFSVLVIVFLAIVYLNQGFQTQTQNQSIIINTIRGLLIENNERGSFYLLQSSVHQLTQIKDHSYTLSIEIKNVKTGTVLAKSGSLDNGSLFIVQTESTIELPQFEQTFDVIIVFNFFNLWRDLIISILILSCLILGSYYLAVRFLKRSLSEHVLMFDEVEDAIDQIVLEFDGADFGTNERLANEEPKKFLLRQLKLIKEKAELAASSAAMVENAKQVSHDIRSPLAALSLVINHLTDIPEEYRGLIKNSVQRINDISNDLLQKSKFDKSSSVDTKPSRVNNQVNTSVIYLSQLVDSIVSEKRTEFRNRSEISIEADLRDSFQIFVNANGQQLSRVLSNLINNSVEAFSAGAGEIRVSIKRGDSLFVNLTVIDNGSGIPDKILRKLGDYPISFGKDSSPYSGSGIGLYNARKCVKSWGGELEVRSTLGQGTEVWIRLRLAPVPLWFGTELKITRGQTVVIVDDDKSIHRLWRSRFENLQLKDNDLNFIFLSSVQEFLNLKISNSMIFLMDYEFIDQKKLNGLDLIIQRGIISKSLLVTSHFDEIELQRCLENVGGKATPKQLASLLPISISDEQVDYILLDNDELVIKTWEINARDKSHRVKLFQSKEYLFDELHSIEKNTKFYIDYDLGISDNGEEIHGVQVAKELFDLGYKNIYITSGFEDLQSSNFSWIKAVVGKNPPS